MWHTRLTNNMSTPWLAEAAFDNGDQETGRNLLADSHGPAPDGQRTATKADGLGAATKANGLGAAPKTDGRIAAETTPGSDKSAVATGASSSQTTETDQRIKDMLSHATQVKANVVIPGQVVEIDDLNFNRQPAWKQPAWNPHAIQKGPVDTIDDLTFDRQGNLKINPNKKSQSSKTGAISIGVEADEVHWSPLFLPLKQEETIRDTVSDLQKNNPHFPIPAPLANVPWACLGTMPVQPEKPAVDPAMFQKLLDMNKLTDRIVAAVAGNEGNLTTVTLNDAGFGWSVGMRQWNQKIGELPTLLGAMYKNDPCKFVKDFGPYASKIMDNVADPQHATVNESFIRQADFSKLLGFTDARHTHVNHVQDVERALSDFQDVQVALSRQFVAEGDALAKRYGFTSELGWAEVCDIVNQKGAGGAEDTIRRIPAATKAKESVRIQALEKAARRPGGQARLASLEQVFSAKTIATDTVAP
jgi:hypothetical protein